MTVRLNWPVVVGFALFLASALNQAHAQNAATTVSGCGSASYQLGQNYPLTQDTSGNLCNKQGVAASTTVIHTQSASDFSVTVAGQFVLASTEVTTKACSTTCFLEIWDSATLPADGTYTGSNSAALCYPIPTDTTSNPWKGGSMANTPLPPRTINGFSIVVNTGADCYTLVKATTNTYVSAQYQQ